MEHSLGVLLGTAVSIAFIHTVIGVDHSLPFVVIGRAQGWSLKRTLAITGLCGVGHVLSSVVLGLLGVALGTALQRLELIESQRGEAASWLLIAFGTAYAAWGAWQALRGRTHTHVHIHDGGVAHVHEHGHAQEHAHPHGTGQKVITVWMIFVIFVFGPCEPLIPLLMFPAMTAGWWAVAVVCIVFSAVTIGTMLAVVTAGYYGLRMVNFRALERHVHTLAGSAIALSGVAIKVFDI